MKLLNSLNQRQARKRYERALALEQAGQIAKAIAELETAVALDPKHVDALNTLGYLRRQQGLEDEALSAFRTAVDADDGHLGACLNLSMMLADRREYEQAMHWLHRCRQIAPELAIAQYEIGYVYYAQNEYETAITEFHRALRLEADWTTHMMLADCYLKLRRDDDAGRQYRHALELARDEKQASQTRRKLAALDRVREFPIDRELGLKDRMYCEHQTVLLGSGQDDGLGIHEYFFYNLQPFDLALMIRRFLALGEALAWQFSAVMAVDEVSRPLALALSDLLSLSSPNDPILLVQAVGATMAPLREALAQVSGRCLALCFAVSWDEDWMPDVAGIVTPMESSVPWSRTTEMARLRVETDSGDLADPNAKRRVVTDPSFVDERPPAEIVIEILEAVAEIEPEDNVADQVAYYTQHHPHLRFVEGV